MANRSNDVYEQYRRKLRQIGASSQSLSGGTERALPAQSPSSQGANGVLGGRPSGSTSGQTPTDIFSNPFGYVLRGSQQAGDYAGGGSQPGSSSGGSSGYVPSEEDMSRYYELLREQRYSELYDSYIQNARAYQMGQAYAQGDPTLASYESQGAAGSRSTALLNAYLNSVAEERREYENDIDEIDTAEREEASAAKEERFATILASIGSATTEDGLANLDSLLQSYGLVSVDGDGNVSWNEKPDWISSDDWLQLQYQYANQASLIGESDDSIPTTGNLFPSKESLLALDAKYYYVDETGNVQEGKIKDDFSKEAELLWQRGARDGTYENGAVISVTNENGRTIYFQWLGPDTGFRQATADDFAEADHAYSIVRDPGTHANSETTVR